MTQSTNNIKCETKTNNFQQPSGKNKDLYFNANTTKIKSRDKNMIQGTDNFSEMINQRYNAKAIPMVGSSANLNKQLEDQNPQNAQGNQQQQRKRKQKRNIEPRFYPGNTYYYPYSYNDTGCFYWPCLNGHCCPCHTFHRHNNCSVICCDPFPCCNGCTGFHCGCCQCMEPCNSFECVKHNNCEQCTCLPCCSGCSFCVNSCDGSCIKALPCCNDCQCHQIFHVIPCCNGCQCEPLFGCLPCCNDNLCNICGCLHDCSIFNCVEGANCDCNGCDCNCCCDFDCNGFDCNCCDSCDCGDVCETIGACIGGLLCACLD